MKPGNLALLFTVEAYKIRALGMVADNEASVIRGGYPAYDNSDFERIADEIDGCIQSINYEE